MGMSAFYLGKDGKPASEPENIEVIHRLGTRQDTVEFALDGRVSRCHIMYTDLCLAFCESGIVIQRVFL